MQFITFISNIAMPFIILIIVLYGLIERKKVFDTFLDGAKEGLEIVLRYISNTYRVICFPSEIMPLALLRPISGSASIAVATDIMKNYGVDSSIGLIASTIMGSTETTLYTIAVYSSSVRIKKTRFVLAAALIADFVGMIVSVTVIKIAIGSGFFWQ